MTPSAITTAAGTLASALAGIKDAEIRLRCAKYICDLLAEALDDGNYGTDVACHLYDAGKVALGNIPDVQQDEALYEAEREARAARVMGGGR